MHGQNGMCHWAEGGWSVGPAGLWAAAGCTRLGAAWGAAAWGVPFGHPYGPWGVPARPRCRQLQETALNVEMNECICGCLELQR